MLTHILAYDILKWNRNVTRVATQQDAENPVAIDRGDTPLVLAFPHGSARVPAEVAQNLNPNGQALADTDWHIQQVYEGLAPGATRVMARFHRYVVDANRDPSGESLYPGQNTTGLVPLTDFDGSPIWAQPPDMAEIQFRREHYHAPYHAALQAEIARIHALHGFVIVYDCHSIRSEIPFLFQGRLPDFNIGTNDGTTCAPALQALVEQHCNRATGYTTVTNGRFKGGWTTRHYGRPDLGYHAIQMELAQSCYMQESPPWAWDQAQAERLRAVLRPMLTAISALDMAHLQERPTTNKERQE
jgi:formiminoglutamase